MTVRYIIGRAGAGAGSRAIAEIGEELQRPEERRLFLLVPEQFTLQAERNLIGQLRLPGIIRAEVLSFNRLVYRVLNETGGKTRVLVNEQGRRMVIKKVMIGLARELSVYKNAGRQEGFIEALSSLLAGFKQYDLTPELLLSKQAEIEDEILRAKLRDIGLIYGAYTEYMTGQYLDLEDQVNLFIDRIDASSLLPGALVWLDKFDCFPPQHLRILEKIMLQATDTTFCLTLDPQPGRDEELFSLSRQGYEQIHGLAVRHHLWEETIRLVPERSVASAGIPAQSLLHLEQELYAYPHRIFPGEADGIELFAAASVYSEAEHAAARIVGLAQEQGWRWRDMAVLASDLEVYGPVISRVFSEYRIPIFLDAKFPIDNHPLIKMILAALAVVGKGYRQEDVSLLMKSGFTGLNQVECEEMENYLLAYGIKGRLFQEQFSRGGDEVGAEQLALLNLHRKKLIVPLQKLEQSLQGSKTGRDLSQRLFRYLQEMEVEAQLQDWTESLRRQGLFEYALENGQIWNIVMETLDQLVEILGDQSITLKDYTAMLETGFKTFSMGIIPTTVDQVTVGDISRSKIRSLKAVFVLGVNDGMLPAVASDAAVFTADETKILQSCQLDWHADRQTRNAEEQFDIYMAFSQAEALLSLSYAIADQEGRALRPSLLIHRFKTLFPRLHVHSDLVDTPETELERLVSPDGSFKHLAEQLRLCLDGEPIHDFWWDVYDWYYRQPHWDQRRHDLLDALFYQNQIGPREQISAGALYKTPFYSSVSRLEQFSACPFAHFVRFGLRPQERRSFAVDMPDIGILLHEGLAAFSTTLAEQGIDWRNLDKDQCERLADQVMTAQLEQHNNGIMSSSYRYRYLGRRLQRITRRAVWTLTEHIQRGDFRPFLYETRFGAGGVFPPLRVDINQEQSFYLEGRVDRIDILEKDDDTYIKIIDYKSGERQLSLAEMYFGLNLQLFVYLLAVLKAGEGEADETLRASRYQPAAMFYFKIDDPMIAAGDGDMAEIEALIRKQLRMRGLVLKDVELVRAMDRDLQGESDILPLGIKNSGEFRAASSVLDAKEFELLLSYLQELLKEIGQKMINGYIRIEPVKTDSWKACDYCGYHAVCQFDKLFDDNHYKNIALVKDRDILNRLKHQREGDADE